MSGFESLHPALQHHIVNSLGWSSLRPLQVHAIDALGEGGHGLLLAPTAGGKTEAAFFPVLSRMLHGNWTGLSVLYVCPLRALLNNLEPRLAQYAQLVGRRVGVWHGDTPSSARRRIIDDPPDVLLTTPESLEVLLVTRREHHQRLFGHLQAVIVDEIHAFAGDDRGWHLLAVLERLSTMAGRPLQRVGLSATVGNPAELLGWLASSVEGPKRVIAPETQQSTDVDLTIDAVESLDNASHVISRLHRGEKRLVFCDSRGKVEDLAGQLRRLDIRTFVSHSSLSLDERRRAEEAFAEGTDCVIVATSTLELGIDVGDLDRVIQIDAPVAVASFLQRLGRTGRRPGAVRNFLFLTTTDESLMQACALVRLWGTGHVEHVRPPALPVHIFAQQLMALSLQQGGIARNDWRRWFGGVSAFAALDAATVDGIIEYMLSVGLLFDDGGVLWMGPEGEREYGRRHFMEIFSAFVAEPLFSVRFGDVPLGSVHVTSFMRWPDAEVVVVLGGRSWRVTYVDWRQRLAYVEVSEREGKSRWAGAGQAIRYELCQAMKDVLLGSSLPARLSQRAQASLDGLRSEFRWLQAGETALVPEAKGTLRWWTFAGQLANAAMADRLSATGPPTVVNNLSIRFDRSTSSAVAAGGIRELRTAGEYDIPPPVSDKAVDGLKFNACLPPGLARRVLQLRSTDRRGVELTLQEPVVAVVGPGS